MAYTIVRIVQQFEECTMMGGVEVPSNDTGSYLRADIILQPGNLAHMRFCVDGKSGRFEQGDVAINTNKSRA
jgi:hypothetical protein